ncbi:hypothetical protein PybrP1_009730, partial [[Pythium] brassicae (nom. inval.)]
MRDADQTLALFSRLRPTHILHLAARVGGLFSNLNYKVDFLRDNLAINDAILPHVGVRKLPLRQFTFSRNLAQLLLWVLDEYDSVEPIILSVGEDGKVSIKD